jgi:hypothetical protein
MNSAYALNSQPRVPTRVCQGHVVTTDLPTLETNPNSKQHGSASQEVKDLGNLQCLGRTVRGALVDSQQGARECPARSRRWYKNGTRTTSTAPRNIDDLYPTLGRSASNSCRADGWRAPGRRSANTLQQKATSLVDRTMNAQEQVMNWTNPRPCRLFAATRRNVRQVQTEQLEPENEKSTPPIYPWISQTS